MAKSKQQLQIMAIAGVFGCIALYVIVQFVIVPMMVDVREVRRETENIYAELDDIIKTVRDRQSLQEQIDESLTKLKHAAAQIPMPVLGNYMIGMEEDMRNCLKGSGVNIIAFLDAGEPSNIRGGSGTFKILQTRVLSTSGLYDLVRAFNKIEKQYPYVSVSGVTISTQDNDPDQHSITFVISWLIWADPEKRPSFLIDVS